MKKRLIFYFYVTPDFFERKTNLCHIECLRHYIHIFDVADFYLSLDDVSDYELINKVEKALLDFGFGKDIYFHIHQNDKYRESAIVKEEIADKLKEMDKELVFFAHGKGYTNLDVYDETSMLHWLIGCYYLSLEFVDEAINLLCGNQTFISFGSFPLVLDKKSLPDDYLKTNELYLGRIKYGWCYSGTFFWLYPDKLVDHMEIFRQDVPKLFDRYYSEKFLGNVMSYASNATGHSLRYLYPNNNMYNDGIAEGCIKFLLGSEASVDYYNFFNKILNDVKEKYGK